MQCLSGLVNGPYFILFSPVGLNFKVLILGRLGLASHLGFISNRYLGPSLDCLTGLLASGCRSPALLNPNCLVSPGPAWEMLSRFSFAKKSSCAARTNYIYKSAREAMFIKSILS